MRLQLYVLLSLVMATVACDCCSSVEQVHIAQGFTPSSMTVSWLSSCAQCDEVSFGTTKGSPNQRVRAATTNYTFDSKDHSFYTSDTIFHASLDSLSSSTTYHYYIGSTEEDCNEFSFTTAPAVGDRKEFVFGIVADLGQTSDSAKTVDQLDKDLEVQVILQAGDMSYADCEQERWDTWGRMVEPLAARVPWMVGVGNHEIEFEDKTGEVFKPYKHRFLMPHVKAGKDMSGPTTSCTPSVYIAGQYNYGNSFYSFEVATAHVIMLNSYTDSKPSSAMYKWLEEDLGAVDRKVTPWLIVVFHCPWYNSNTAHHEEAQAIAMKGHMEELLYKHRVNAVISGHVHAYERSYPIFKGKQVADGIQYFVIGDGGNREGHANKYDTKPSWSAFRDGDNFGAARMNLVNSTHMKWAWHRNVDGRSDPADDSWILNDFALRNHIN